MTKILDTIKENKKSILAVLTSGGVLLFTVLIYLPCDTYFNNFNEFNFPVYDFLLPLFLIFLLSLAVVGALGVFVGKKVGEILTCGFLGLTLCVDVQYMFSNGNLGLMIGEQVNWSEYTSFGIFNSITWITVFCLPFIFKSAFKKAIKLYPCISAFLGGIQLLSVILLTFSVGNEAFCYRNDSLDGGEQYVISGKKNIVTFVFDTADNIFLGKILQDNPEAFEGLEDFTLYTNTCSVHDYTLASMTQMLTGAEDCPMYDTDNWLESAWDSEKAEDFYNRFHNAGYRINAFMRAEVPTEFLNGKIDNASAGVTPLEVDKSGIERDIFKLTLYRGLPFMLKKFVDVSTLDLKGHVTFSKDFYYYDDEYMKNLILKESEKDNNYFIIEHLNGPHPPCDDVTEETINCLNIVKEYIRQMKEMGVYENSSIIITSDHGRHTSDFSAGAVTPIFMIKEANKSFDKMQVSNAPVYHGDFLATYLYEAGLYTNSDKEIYGNTVFDFEEGSARERIWYDHTSDNSYPNPNGASCNVYHAYKYTGGSEELKKVINDNDIYEVIVKK